MLAAVVTQGWSEMTLVPGGKSGGHCHNQSADNFINAEMIEQSGLGRRLLPDEVTPGAIARAVADVLANPAPARRAAAEIATMPAPSEVAQLLHERHS